VREKKGAGIEIKYTGKLLPPKMAIGTTYRECV